MRKLIKSISTCGACKRLCHNPDDDDNFWCGIKERKVMDVTDEHRPKDKWLEERTEELSRMTKKHFKTGFPKWCPLETIHEEKKNKRTCGAQRGFERKETFDAKEMIEVLETNNLLVKKDKAGRKKMMINGDSIKTNSLRLRCFVHKGLKCKHCGIVGEFFAKERGIKEASRGFKTYHLNLYARVNGGERLMTQDHKIPRSKGGKNTLKNSQTLCVKCNGKKADRMP